MVEGPAGALLGQPCRDDLVGARLGQSGLCHGDGGLCSSNVSAASAGAEGIEIGECGVPFGCGCGHGGLDRRGLQETSGSACSEAGAGCSRFLDHELEGLSPVLDKDALGDGDRPSRDGTIEQAPPEPAVTRVLDAVLPGCRHLTCTFDRVRLRTPDTQGDECDPPIAPSSVSIRQFMRTPSATRPGSCLRSASQNRR